MTKFIVLDAPKTIELHSTWHYNHGSQARSVFFIIRHGDEYVTTITMTPQEARTFGSMLTEEADRITSLGSDS